MQDKIAFPYLLNAGADVSMPVTFRVNRADMSLMPARDRIITLPFKLIVFLKYPKKFCHNLPHK